MEHYNPLLKHNHSPKKFFAIGEIMLCLTPPNYEKIRMATNFEASYGGSENSLKAFMWYEGHTFESKLFTFHILDRVGGGDAFASGLIYAMIHNYRAMDMVNFAVASSVLKHTIHGDANITDDAQGIRSLMNMNYDIKR